jgi:hypothetical protein
MLCERLTNPARLADHTYSPGAGHRSRTGALEVKLIDIWAVSEFIKGEQHALFLGPETDIAVDRVSA